jgi:hypothetical protein
VQKIAEDSRGNHLYVKPDGVGGRLYWSDEVGGGVIVWNTSLVSPEMLRLALAAEERRLGSPSGGEDVNVYSAVLKPNGTLTLKLGWRGGFRTLVFTGGPFDAIRNTDCDFGVCVRAENVPATGVDVHLPIPDFSVPASQGETWVAVRQAFEAALEGKKVYVGCLGGWGRTGLFLALLAKAAGVEDPVAFVRANYTSRAVETKAQQRFVDNFDTAALTSHVRRYAWRQWLRLFRSFMR